MDDTVDDGDRRIVVVDDLAPFAHIIERLPRLPSWLNGLDEPLCRHFMA